MYFSDEAYREAMDDRFSRPATMGEAHAEWHRNAGVPMGTPGCPQDACHDTEAEDAWNASRCWHGLCAREYHPGDDSHRSAEDIWTEAEPAPYVPAPFTPADSLEPPF